MFVTPSPVYCCKLPRCTRNRLVHLHTKYVRLLSKSEGRSCFVDVTWSESGEKKCLIDDFDFNGVSDRFLDKRVICFFFHRYHTNDDARMTIERENRIKLAVWCDF